MTLQKKPAPHYPKSLLSHWGAVMLRIIAIGVTWTSVWWLIVGFFLAPIVPGGWLTIILGALVAVAPLLVLVGRFRGGYPSKFTRLFIFRPFWYLQLATLLMALAGVAGFIVGLPFGAAVAAGRAAVLGVGGCFAVAIVVGYVGSKQLRIKQLNVAFSDLPAALDAMRIAQISDLHVGPHTSRRFLDKVVQSVQSAKPDVIAVTGDQVDDYAGDVKDFAAAFSALSATHGVFAVAGNHDVYAGWRQVRAGLEGMGVTVLVNDAVEIERGGVRFWIAGTGDPAGAVGPIGRDATVAPDIARTLARVPTGAFTIVLAHNPALWPALADRGVQLTLSGHTHYGQLSVPHIDWSLASLFLEHAMGWYSRGESQLYINPGTNYWGLPLRIGALPEVTIITLRSRSEPSPVVAS